MILRYGLFTIVMAIIPYCLLTDNYSLNIVKPMKKLTLNVLSQLVNFINKLVPLNTSFINLANKNVAENNPNEVDSQINIFTDALLKEFDGKQSDKIYLSILGHVFDVTKGKKHYGSGGSYNKFAGKDASRSFVTGDFTEEGLSDDVIDLQFEDLRGLKQWLEFYYKEYVYKGKLAGRYFDSNGLPTLYNHKLTARIEEADKHEEIKLQSKLMYPPCNVEWSVEDGSRVWCTTSSGGIDRDWVGVPRKLYLPGQNKYRCACVNLLHSSNKFPADNTLRNGNLEGYTGCHSKSSSCHVEK